MVGHTWICVHQFKTMHRGAFWLFSFRWIYYCHSSKSTGKETGKTHLCNVLNSSKVLNGSLANNNWAPGSSKNVKNESYSLNYLQTNESFTYRFSWFETLEIKFEIQNWQSLEKEKCSKLCPYWTIRFDIRIVNRL